MSLLRLEWLRLVRTRRLLVLLSVYTFFGFVGPLTTRYLETILRRLGTAGVTVQFPTPTPTDGIAEFVSNASQIGLLVVVLIAASALSFDARRESAIFLRTRVASVRQILLPAYGTNTAAAAGSLVVGTIAAWYETGVLLGPLSTSAMLVGTGYGALFLAFAVAVVALAASLLRGMLATAGTSLALLLGLGIVGGLTGWDRWLPTSLLTAVVGLLQGRAATYYLPATGLTVALSAAALWAAVVLGNRREI